VERYNYYGRVRGIARDGARWRRRNVHRYAHKVVSASGCAAVGFTARARVPSSLRATRASFPRFLRSPFHDECFIIVGLFFLSFYFHFVLEFFLLLLLFSPCPVWLVTKFEWSASDRRGYISFNVCIHDVYKCMYNVPNTQVLFAFSCCFLGTYKKEYMALASLRYQCIQYGPNSTYFRILICLLIIMTYSSLIISLNILNDTSTQI